MNYLSEALPVVPDLAGYGKAQYSQRHYAGASHFCATPSIFSAAF
jgi:hypothetical protein